MIDHGPGLPADQLAGAVRPFHRFEDRGGGGGVGLGLPICLGFCEAMGATLEFHETPGGGLSVRVRLPVAGRDLATNTGGLA
ncbi:MAG: ATP-binding protein [Ilumatobacteraceae bacterium]